MPTVFLSRTSSGAVAFPCSDLKSSYNRGSATPRDQQVQRLRRGAHAAARPSPAPTLHHRGADGVRGQCAFARERPWRGIGCVRCLLDAAEGLPERCGAAPAALGELERLACFATRRQALYCAPAPAEAAASTSTVAATRWSGCAPNRHRQRPSLWTSPDDDRGPGGRDTRSGDHRPQQAAVHLTAPERATLLAHIGSFVPPPREIGPLVAPDSASSPATPRPAPVHLHVEMRRPLHPPPRHADRCADG